MAQLRPFASFVVLAVFIPLEGTAVAQPSPPPKSSADAGTSHVHRPRRGTSGMNSGETNFDSIRI